jgi:hypothetical protein
MADTATTCPSAMSTTSLVYWKEPMVVCMGSEVLINPTFPSQTGPIFGVVLACLVSLTYCSLLSVLAHLALCLLCAVLGVYTVVMVKAGKMEATWTCWPAWPASPWSCPSPW